MSKWRNFWDNLVMGVGEKELLIAELRRQVDAQQAHINELKQGEWVAKSFDAEHDRDRWRDAATHLAGLGKEDCDVYNCYYCNLAYGSVMDHMKRQIREALRGE